MELEAKVADVIYQAIDELNLTKAKHERVSKTPETKLLGEGGELDSLSLVNFMVTLEEKIQEKLAVNIDFYEAFSGNFAESPLKSVGALTQYISSRLPA